MERAFVVSGVLFSVGILLFAGPLVFVKSSQSTYSVDASQVDSPPDDAPVVALEDVDASLRDGVREAIESSRSVTVGHQYPSVPTFVHHDGQVYSIAILGGDPGGGGAVISLASFGLGLVTFVSGVGALALGLLGRYRW